MKSILDLQNCEKCLRAALGLLSREPQTNEIRRLVALVTQVKERLDHSEIGLAREALDQLAKSMDVPSPVAGVLFHAEATLERIEESSAAWKARYPHIASWPRGPTMYGPRGGLWHIELSIISGSRFASSHNTRYIVIEKEIPVSTRYELYQALDDAIKEWKDERGPEELQRLERGWIGEAAWEASYPHIADWIGRGKRHCIHIEINFVAGTSSIKAWLYDRASGTETVLVEKRLGHSMEHEVLSTLDEAIGVWMSTHRDHRALGVIPDEAEQ